MLKRGLSPSSPTKKFAMGFRMQGKRWLITWSATPTEFDHLEIFNLLDDFAKVKDYVGALEFHQDGTPHFHAYVEFADKPDRNVTTQLDWKGCHPNFAPKKSKKAAEAAAEYCKKGTDWIEYHSDEAPEDYEVPEKDDIMELAHEASSWKEWISYCFANDIPYAYCSASWNATKDCVETVTSETPIYGSVVSPELQLHAYDPTTLRSVVITGPPGCGKTTWARVWMPKPILFVTHIDQLKNLRSGFHQSIVFDDMHFAGDENGKGAWPRTSQIHLVDREIGRAIHTRYTISYIPAGIHKCFTANVYPFIVDPAIERRIFLMEL